MGPFFGGLVAASEVKICNSALIKIGAETITTLSDDNKRARACNEQYQKCRDEVLAAHPWHFAMIRKTLATTANTPVWGFAYEFAIPSGILRIVSTDTDYDWKVETNAAGTATVVVTDSPTMNIKAIQKVTDTTLFTPLFDEVLATRLGADLAYHLVQSSTLQAALQDTYIKMLAQARSFNAQEGTADNPDATDWLNSRF